MFFCQCCTDRQKVVKSSDQDSLSAMEVGGHYIHLGVQNLTANSKVVTWDQLKIPKIAGIKRILFLEV